VPIIGKIGRRLRYICCKSIFTSCGKNVNIERNAYFGTGFNVSIGDNSGLGVNCHVLSNIQIGNDVMMGPNCYILDRNHRFDQIDKPMRLQGYSGKTLTIIEDDVWIGRDVLFTPGRTIKKGTVIAARCVLCKDFPAYSVIGGNPSKIIKLRINDL
jgi:maltose O-acetyltransferase